MKEKETTLDPRVRKDDSKNKQGCPLLLSFSILDY